MKEANDLVRSALKMLQESELLEQVKAFVKTHEGYWIHSNSSGSGLVSMDISINFSTIGQKNKEEVKPWFQCSIGAIGSKRVCISIFPDNSMMEITWWQEWEVVKCETVKLNK